MKFIYICRNAAWIYCTKPEGRTVFYHSEQVRLFQGYLSLAVRRHKPTCQLFRESYINLIYKFPYRKSKRVTLRLCLSIKEKKLCWKQKRKFVFTHLSHCRLSAKLETRNIEMIPERRNSGAKHSCRKCFSPSVQWQSDIIWQLLICSYLNTQHKQSIARNTLKKLLVNNVNSGRQHAPTTHRKYWTTPCLHRE